MAIGMAILIVIYRRWPTTPAAGPSTVSSLILIPFAYAFGSPITNSGQDVLLLSVFGLIFSLGSVTLAEGTKRISAGEAGLLSNLEIAFAPALAWLMFSESPAISTIVGGIAIIIGTLISQFPTRANVQSSSS